MVIFWSSPLHLTSTLALPILLDRKSDKTKMLTACSAHHVALVQKPDALVHTAVTLRMMDMNWSKQVLQGLLCKGFRRDLGYSAGLPKL